MKSLIYVAMLVSSTVLAACSPSYKWQQTVPPNVPDSICAEAGINCYFDYQGERFYWNARYKCWCGPHGHFIGGRYHHGYPHH